MFKRWYTGWLLVAVIVAVGWVPPLVDQNMEFALAYMLLITSICTIAAITLAVLNVIYFFFGNEGAKSVPKS